MCHGLKHRQVSFVKELLSYKYSSDTDLAAQCCYICLAWQTADHYNHPVDTSHQLDQQPYRYSSTHSSGLAYMNYIHCNGNTLIIFFSSSKIDTATYHYYCYSCLDPSGHSKICHLGSGTFRRIQFRYQKFDRKSVYVY